MGSKTVPPYIFLTINIPSLRGRTTFSTRLSLRTFSLNAITPLVCGSFAAEMAHGKGPDELLEVTGEAILERLAGLPEEEAHCAFLAAETLQEALNDYMIKQAGCERNKGKKG